MTHDRGASGTPGRPPAGAHRIWAGNPPAWPGAVRRRARIAVILVGTLGAVGVGGAWVSGAVGGDGGRSGVAAASSCRNGHRVLTVAAAPEIAPALVAATDATPGSILGDRARCFTVRVLPRAAADVAATLGSAASSDRADLWVPDSSLWLRGAAAPPTVKRTPYVSIARSPLVFAVPRPVAERLHWPRRPLNLVTAIGAEPGLRLGVPDVGRSAAARAALLVVQRALPPLPGGRERLATTLRAAERSVPESPFALLDAMDGDPNLVVPVPEQAAWARARRVSATPDAVVSYPKHGPAFDYPLVLLARSATVRADARTLQVALRGSAWAARAQAAGFRAADGSAGPALRARDGVDPTLARDAVGPDPVAVQQPVRAFATITMGTRLLAVLDVSGSMSTIVPGTGERSRMNLAVGAATSGLGLYTDDARVGLWIFSRRLTPGSDHRELVPIGPLGPRPDGVNGREKVAAALDGVSYVPHGDTGLYDTVLDAVRAVRAGWDPKRVNSVVLLTDGRNDDANSLTLDQLLSRLKAEAGRRPVPVIALALGPDSDIGSLRRISDVTEGTTYEVRDVRRIREVLTNALAQRPCRPHC
jgi:Ca-activated chloride channel family protein